MERRSFLSWTATLPLGGLAACGGGGLDGMGGMGGMGGIGGLQGGSGPLANVAQARRALPIPPPLSGT